MWQSGGGRQAKTPTLGETWAFGLVGYTQGNVLLAPNPKYPNCNVGDRRRSRTPASSA